MDAHPQWQFWWNWWINFAVALATFAAAIVALFGEWLRSKMFPARLKLSLLNANGEKGRIAHGDRQENARFYHVRVENTNRFVSTAKDVQVFLIRIEEPGPDDELQIVWSGEIPMRWRNQEVSALTKAIGHATDCDLCSVGENRWLSLSPLIVPLSMNARREGPCKMVVSLQARSQQADSPALRVQIAWDGAWDLGDNEMRRHLTVRELTTHVHTLQDLPHY
jgi:hypothetical protein